MQLDDSTCITWTVEFEYGLLLPNLFLVNGLATVMQIANNVNGLATVPWASLDSLDFNKNNVDVNRTLSSLAQKMGWQQQIFRKLNQAGFSLFYSTLCCIFSMKKNLL